MRHAQLMIADDLMVANFPSLRAPDKVLGLRERVAKNALVRNHRDKFVGGHRFS
jgi:hypothetical protein